MSADMNILHEAVAWAATENATRIIELQKENAVLRTAAEAARGDCEKLRCNFAEYLAPLYRENPVAIAKLCDEKLDRTGILLGYVRGWLR